MNLERHITTEAQSGLFFLGCRPRTRGYIPRQEYTQEIIVIGLEDACCLWGYISHPLF